MRQWVLRLGGLVKVQAARLRRAPYSTEYVAGAPSPRHALDLFRGEWTSAFPAPLDTLRAGSIPLFDDKRLAWAIDALGGVAGAHVLELGPLEGGHTWMLEQRGAASITAIEANGRAYLKCLVVKEVLGLARARFLLGDFVEYLRGSPPAADVAMASGVLYHMTEPVELIARLSRVSPRLYLWTHYYDEALVRARPKVAARFSRPERRVFEDFACDVHPLWYQVARYRPGFCGGGITRPCWMTRDAILEALGHFGYSRIETGFEEPGHPHGPAFSLVAFR